MPNIKSAKKRNRQAQKNRTRNRHQRSALRTAIRLVREAPDAGAAADALKSAERLLDRAARKNIVHPNAAGRVKSRLRKSLSAQS